MKPEKSESNPTEKVADESLETGTKLDSTEWAGTPEGGAMKRKAVDESVKIARIEARKAKRELKKKALATIVEFAKSNSNWDASIQEAVAMFIKTPKTPKTPKAPRVTITDKIKNMLGKAGAVHEDRLWKEYKVGRAEMKYLCGKVLGAKVPLFVSFNIETGMYTLEGEGTVPGGWIGKLPK